MTKEDKQIIERATKEEWRIGDRTRLKRLLEKNLKQYRDNVELENKNKLLGERCNQLLKDKGELIDDNKVMADNYSKMEQKFYDNLTKAKEIIKEFMKYEINEYDGSLEIHFEELKKQAGDFIKE